MDLGELGLRVTAIGVGATAVMDLWTIAQKRLFGIPSLDYAMVGRWLAGLTQGKVVHDAISQSPPIAGERAIGWTAHYVIGIGFAGLLVAVAGKDWLGEPLPGVAILVGLATVAAPFLILQPGMGAGVAASRTPRPAVARTRSVIAHLAFGIGLYLGGVATTIMAPLGCPMRRPQVSFENAASFPLLDPVRESGRRRPMAAIATCKAESCQTANHLPQSWGSLIKRL